MPWFFSPGIRWNNWRAKWRHEHGAARWRFCSHLFGRLRQLRCWQGCTQPIGGPPWGRDAVGPWPRFIFRLLQPHNPLPRWAPSLAADLRDSGSGGVYTGRRKSHTGRNSASAKRGGATTERGGVRPVSKNNWLKETGRYEQQDFILF